MKTKEYKDILISFKRTSYEPFDGTRVMLLMDEVGSDIDILDNHQIEVTDVLTRENTDNDWLQISAHVCGFNFTLDRRNNTKPIMYFPEPMDLLFDSINFDKIRFEKQMKFISDRVFRCNITIVHDWFDYGSNFF